MTAPASSSSFSRFGARHLGKEAWLRTGTLAVAVLVAVASARGWLIPAAVGTFLLTATGCLHLSAAMHRTDRLRVEAATADLDATRTQLARTSGLLWGLADSALLDPTITTAVEREARATDRLLGLPGSDGTVRVPFDVNPDAAKAAWDGRHVRVLP